MSAIENTVRELQTARSEYRQGLELSVTGSEYFAKAQQAEERRHEIAEQAGSSAVHLSDTLTEMLAEVSTIGAAIGECTRQNEIIMDAALTGASTYERAGDIVGSAKNGIAAAAGSQAAHSVRDPRRIVEKTQSGCTMMHNDAKKRNQHASSVEQLLLEAHEGVAAAADKVKKLGEGLVSLGKPQGDTTGTTQEASIRATNVFMFGIGDIDALINRINEA